MAFNIFRNKKTALLRLEAVLARYHKEYPISKNPTVLSIIHSISSTVSTLGFDLYQRGKNGSYKAYTHPISMLLERPNSEECPTQFLYRMTHHYLSTGNVYILNQNTMSLRVLDSTRMKVERLSNGSYEKVFNYDGKVYTEAEIIHIYNPQYFDGTVGHSPIEYNADMIELLNELLLYVGTYFRNSAGERIYITPDKDSVKDLKDPAVKKEFERFIAVNMYDPLSKGKPMLALPGMKVDSIKQTTNAESELNSLIDRIEKEVAKLFSYPIYKLTGDYGNNLSAQQVNYLQGCILPITEIFKEKFKSLLPAKDRPFMYFDFDYSNLLMVDIETKHKILREDVRGSLITINEARKEIGRDIYIGDDSLGVGDWLWSLANNRPVSEQYRDLYIQATRGAAEASQVETANTN